jgi:mannose-6-phosphate isomerase-like protein (cupin superfamily)
MGRKVNKTGSRQDKRRIYNPVQKDVATFLETSEETGGERTLAVVEVAPGGGTRPHYHKTYAEHFEVIEGTLEVLVGRETRVLRAGQKAVVPKNTLHRFHNATGETVTFLCEMRPGQPGFKKIIRVGYGLARDGLTRSDGIPKNLYHMALLLDWSEIRVPGFFTVIEPLMRLLAKRARRKGIDRELEARYCR